MKKRTVNIKPYILAFPVIVSLLWVSPHAVFAQSQIDGPPKILLSSKILANGNVLLLQITEGRLDLSAAEIEIEYNKKIYRVHRHPINGDRTYFALVGVPYHSKPGVQELVIKCPGSNGYQSRRIAFEVVRGKYGNDFLKVDSKRIDPNRKDRNRVSREHQEVKHVYASSSSERIWDGPFQLPVENEISSRFGNRRVFNGKLKSYHNGLDFRSPPGTPIKASNSGVVRVAKNLFYSGNAVIIDHGTDIFTIYAHLSKIYTKAGRRIEKGQLIGLSGATGRVSGPHLHWGVKINGVAVDPLQFVEVTDGLVQQQSLSRSGMKSE